MFASYKVFAKDISLPHSIFALPFTFTGLLLSDFSSISIGEILSIVLCMFFARSFAMGMNRFLDREIDRKNPRTKNREIPSGHIKPRDALLLTLLNGVFFVLTSSYFNKLTLFLSLPVLAILGGYSYLKRFTWSCHLYLGGCLGLAPLAACIALEGSNYLGVILLGCAVMFWTAGFDILYAAQDYAFDKKSGLNSIPTHFGIAKSLWISRLFFFLMIFFLVVSGFVSNTGFWFYLAIGLVGSILTYEQWLVRDLKISGASKNMNKAFFTMNGWVSVVFFLFAQLDYLLR